MPTMPPDTVGAVGAVWSRRTVACTQFEVRPALSTARNRTSVWPWADTVAPAPAVEPDQVEPPSVEVWYS